MKCPSCYSELQPNAKICEFCGYQFPAGNQNSQEQTVKTGCPKCGSSDITFNREKLGEVNVKNGRAVVRKTVGVCKSCGYTWYTDDNENIKKKSSIWLWILGWICIFPVPLTILITRNKNMKTAVKAVIIVAAWLLYLAIAFTGKSSESGVETTSTSTEITAEDSTGSDSATNDSSVLKEGGFIINATEKGDYGKDLVLNEGTDMPDNIIGYFVPSGKYEVINIGDKPIQVNVYKNEKNKTEEGWEEWANSSVILLKANEAGEINVEEGYFVNVDEPAELVLNPIN